VLESISSSQHNDNFVQSVDSLNYLCEICNEKFFDKKNYDRHLSSRKHSNKLVELNWQPESKKLFIVLGYFIHLFFYFLQKDSYSVIIDESNSKSNSFSVLESISSSQHNDNFVQSADSQNYLCEICNEKFFNKKNYDRHLSSRKHSNKLIELNRQPESK
jgi:hypothetical protein